MHSASLQSGVYLEADFVGSHGFFDIICFVHDEEITIGQALVLL